MSDRPGREVELKLRVQDLAALLKIAIASGGVPDDTAHQTNSFFDTPDRALGARGFLLRLREERTPAAVRFFVTAKGGGQRSGNLTNVLEEEVLVTADTAKAIRAGATDPLLSLAGGTEARQHLVAAMRAALQGRLATLMGSFANERTRIPVSLPFVDGGSFQAVLELDRVSFPNGSVHHEVEMEVPAAVDPAAAGAAFQALFQRAGVAGKKSHGKARRFFNALRGERLD